jgi:Mrp family chromosome partitioning ATPase
MLRRSRLPVLARIAGSREDEARVWSLRRDDLRSMAAALPRLGERGVVLVTGEGDATRVAALGLAAAAASQGRRSALVECDVANPRLAADLGLRTAPGLHEYLRWEARPEEILQPLVLTGPAAQPDGEALACICAGRPAQKAATLLGLGSFAHAIAKLRSAYELVVLAGPSVAKERDAAVAAAAQAEGVVAALPAASSSGRDARATAAALRRLPPPALGMVAVRDGSERLRTL